MSVCVVLNVSELEVLAVDGAEYGTSADVANDVKVGMVDGIVSRVMEEGKG